jgi:hypothetical protein
VKRSGRVGRCCPCTHPCERWPRARSLAACSAVLWTRVPPTPRPRLLWPLARPPSSTQEHLARCCACPCARARSAGRPGCGAWWSWTLNRSMCFSARAGTA